MRRRVWCSWVLPPWVVVVAVAGGLAVACDIHAERHLAKAGGSNCKGRGISHPWNGAQREWKGQSKAEGCTSEARKPGETPCGREGRSSPWALLRRGVAGQEQAPQRVGS